MMPCYPNVMCYGTNALFLQPVKPGFNLQYLPANQQLSRIE